MSNAEESVRDEFRQNYRLSADVTEYLQRALKAFAELDYVSGVIESETVAAERRQLTEQNVNHLLAYLLINCESKCNEQLTVVRETQLFEREHGYEQ